MMQHEVYLESCSSHLSKEAGRAFRWDSQFACEQNKPTNKPANRFAYRLFGKPTAYGIKNISWH